ncbi:FtsX-like permease family protein [candidate division KSB1 bacterium]|nr:FtsX-like permease family protein [candidate division KSB1 bacterium]
MTNPKTFFNPWVWKTAWRDSRTHRRRMILFSAAIVLGIAALVAIRSLGEDLERAVDTQAKTLLGADLLLESRQPFNDEVQTFIDSLGGEQAREVRFSSMVYFPKTGGTRLARIRSLEGDYPFYGEFTAEPQSAAHSFKSGPFVLVEDALLLQYDAHPGDSLKIGAVTFAIAGRLKNVPGESAADAFIGPRVYFPMRYLEQTDLLQRGSQVTYSVHFKFNTTVNEEQLLARLKPLREKFRLSYETVASQKEDLGEGMRNLYQFLSLVGFIALVLGSVGVASAIHVYIKQKLNTVAVLRCLGASGKQTFGIFLIQALALGLVGSSLGVLLGLYLQTLLPKVLSDFLPVQIAITTSWSAVAEGLGIGLGMALFFALLPLLNLRKVSPLLAIRSFYEEQRAKRDWLKALAYVAIVLVLVIFARLQSPNWRVALGFSVGLAIAFGFLFAVAKLLMKVVKTYFPSSWSYIWRQSLANLYRPQNQTLTMILALGLGTFLIATLLLVQQALLRQIKLTSTGEQPNLVLFDIQTDQKEGVAEILRVQNLPLLQQVPVVTMRLEEINGKNVREIQKDTTRGIPSWALRREYRSSYRDNLNDNEKLLAGTLQTLVAGPNDTIRVSLEDGIAKSLGVKIGDELVFDVQGVPVKTVVGSLREVNWRRLMPSFFVIFPPGSLEQAPQFHVLVTRVPNAESSARLQRAVVQTFPNVSAIDITLVLRTADNILSKVAFVIRFMALFSILTGLTVLAGAVITSRYQRLQESVLLRTLGASRKQVLKIMTLEYLFLGGLAALTGLLLAFAASWALAHFVFETSFVPEILPTLVIIAGVVALTILLGMVNSRGLVDRSPLEILRVEV